MEYRIKTEVCVIGAGHAGCEAALACARLGLDTTIFTMNVDSIAMMPCNPHIGGSSKGHLVREIDALGGEMGKNIDKTFIQSKMLNVSKGPAVHSLRAQADKAEYSKEMRRVLEGQEQLHIRQAEVTEILLEEAEASAASEDKLRDKALDRPEDTSASSEDKARNKSRDRSTDRSEDSIVERKGGKRVTGVRIVTGTVYECRAVIVCTGTYLNARCLVGECITETGPSGMQRSELLSASLESAGIPLRRFKTGTPARMDGRSLDYSKMTVQQGDPVVVPFSYSTDPAEVQIEQFPCYLTYTNEETHHIIRENIDRSPIYAGIIEGTGPRYCPSIEDKVVKFAEKTRHQVFIEPEGRGTNEVYVDGMSSSMPDDVQQRMYRTVPGLEHCEIIKNAYAIEYDCINANILKPTLEIKDIYGLFCAGQFNGSSGYEEAAAQGLIAGINAAMEFKGKEPLIIERSEGYIGVLIDDLVSKDNREPYRMMTSRAEYRLLLRQDNADLRLRRYGYRVGLITREQYEALCNKEEAIHKEIERLKRVKVGGSRPVQEFLAAKNSAELKTACSLAELLCRPELDYDALAGLDPDRPKYSRSVTEQVEIEIRYEGYIERQRRQVEQFEKLERRHIPEDIDYDEVKSLRIEARQKLKQYRPASIGQATRLSGVTPADVQVLLIYLEKFKK
ncbi:tRNA uridine-5-carboxymethylaminomethyl(34) synthesis enzyme MnmG [Lachnoclostridium sp. Marseille-P6806]|uniref:tRNA uridine-5-carboxymethylaminomethyl(34) synthesis enzyme MnmG n=1 Tax=Lachnoclostridium sp. Marseille-P6806 TaxID=2364793 RepID=UPI00102FCD74|nr:tRNA uridine-5-carboxymethylaminomethyl(34) synthesis enzyme MnmG [Lachnoclostridium sp. Marseille-P6806]